VVVDKKTDSEGKEVETRTIQNLTFREYYDTSYKLGKAIIGKNLAYKEPNHDMKLMGIYCKNRYEWIISDLACMMMGVVTVPLYDTLGV
jgi:long-subunit acyl-CoA synthetase (AMP-forming)